MNLVSLSYPMLAGAARVGGKNKLNWYPVRRPENTEQTINGSRAMDIGRLLQPMHP